jgi:Amino-transferase class IV
VAEVWAPTTKYQLAGITRANVLRLCSANDIAFAEKDFSLTSVYSAEEAFVTGTFAGLIPVTQACLKHVHQLALAVVRLLHAPWLPQLGSRPPIHMSQRFACINFKSKRQRKST